MEIYGPFAAKISNVLEDRRTDHFQNQKEMENKNKKTNATAVEKMAKKKPRLCVCFDVKGQTDAERWPQLQRGGGGARTGELESTIERRMMVVEQEER